MQTRSNKLNWTYLLLFTIKLSKTKYKSSNQQTRQQISLEIYPRLTVPDKMEKSVDIEYNTLSESLDPHKHRRK